jgi:hypothetical protein
MIWRYYEVVGRGAGVARTDVGKYMMAELLFSEEQLRRRIPGNRTEYEEETLQMYRKIAIGPKGKECFGLTDEWGLDVKKYRRADF